MHHRNVVWSLLPRMAYIVFSLLREPGNTQEVRSTEEDGMYGFKVL